MARGDAQFGIRSFSVRTSPAAILRLAISLICLNYGVVACALGVGAARAATESVALAALRRAGLAAFAALTAVRIHRRASAVDASDSGAVFSLYMTLWRDFYLAYACLPFAR